jgi:ribosomal protein L12E/L44/L45/RPP1/RPP2
MNPPATSRGLLAVALVFLVSPAVLADSVDYARDVKPLLARRCSSCHGPLKQRAGLRLDTVKRIRKGSDFGPVIVPGKSAESLLIAAVSGKARVRMPPKGKPLSPKEVNLVRAWIDAGATGPVDEVEVTDPRQHWAYRSPTRPKVPAVKNAGWVRNPIDNFVARGHESHGLRPRPEAAREVLLRRVYLDLIGLPPTRAQLHAFLADDSPNAYEKAVDRLLASPHYGERWGRHWMDVWRYSDWYGRRASGEIRYSQRHIWRWRDWIIESANADKGYDRMILEMLAGDELAPGDDEVVRATGFVGRNWYKFDRDVWLRETVEHTAMGFLALTLKCARCHDHKYDPIAQKDYYRFRAFFEPHDVRIDPLGEKDLNKDGLAQVYDARPKTPTYLFIGGDDRNPDKDHPLSPGVPPALGDKGVKIEPVALPVEAYYPALRPKNVEGLLSHAREAVASAEARARQTEERQKGAAGTEKAVRLEEKRAEAARAELHSLERRIAADRAKYADQPDPRLPTLTMQASEAEKQAALLKAELAVLEGKKGAEKRLAAARAALKQKGAKYTPLGPLYPKTSTGRRLALARWIARGDNPRTARVAVNHVWKRHFGKALVPTLANFGLAGKPPSHPELLDWLAVEFVESGWSLKHLHRLMVTSATYRMASTPSDLERARDPTNRYLWRMNSRRMEAEVVRDSMLHLAGQLEEKMGGPELAPERGQTSGRRSVYFRVTPDDKMEFLELFDLANPDACYERQESVVPQQALAVLNSALALREARLLARELAPEARDESAFVTSAFEAVLGRRPTQRELTRCVGFLKEQTRLLAEPGKLTPFPGKTPLAPAKDPALRARENLVHVLFNHNEFVTVR